MIRQDVNGLPQYKLHQAIAYINDHLAENLSLRTIAQQIGISQFYFCRLFKQATGITPYQYLLQQRIERAKQLLLQRQLSIAEVALEVGFSNQSHFTRLFKQMMGITPKRFIQKGQADLSPVSPVQNVSHPPRVESDSFCFGQV